jgi:hypothetical protein
MDERETPRRSRECEDSCGLAGTLSRSGTARVARAAEGFPCRTAGVEGALWLQRSSAFAARRRSHAAAVEGPQKSLGYNPHEFVHSITNPLSDAPRWEALQARAQPLFDAVRELPEQAEMRSIAQLFDECLVRAIVLRYDIGGDAARTARREAAMRQEYLAGFILERFFFEALAAYEMTSESLADFYPKMLEQLDPAVELARWRAARSAAKR